MLASAPPHPSPLRTLLKQDCDLGAGTRFRVWEHDGSWLASGRPAAHAGVELSWIREGRVSYQLGSSRHVVEAGSLMAVPAQAEHITVLETAVRGVAMWLDCALVSEVAEAVSPGPGAVRLQPGPVAPGSLPTLLCLLERELLCKDRAWQMATDALVEAITIELLRAAPTAGVRRGPRDPRILAALETIEARYAEALSVDELARAAGMSRFHFSRLFREELGRAPYQHLLRVRIARAADLLRRGGRTVTEVAYDVGFQDLGRFSRLFRAQVGCLPSEIARAGIRTRSAGRSSAG